MTTERVHPQRQISQNHSSGNDFAPFIIRHANHSHLANIRVLKQRGLNLERRKLVTTRLDDVDGGTPQDAIGTFINNRNIAGQKPAVGKRLCSGLRVTPILLKAVRLFTASSPGVAGSVISSPLSLTRLITTPGKGCPHGRADAHPHRGWRAPYPTRSCHSAQKRWDVSASHSSKRARAGSRARDVETHVGEALGYLVTRGFVQCL